YEGANSFDGEFLPDAIRRIEERQNRLCVNIDYNLVYYHSDAVEYACVLQKIARFMLEHPGPFYIHCRLGSDRTGVTCAVFAALCGASWEDIAADYERTSVMGIGEYRSRRLLQYSLSKMTGRDPASSSDLCRQMQSFFLAEGILSSDEMERLIQILNAAPEEKAPGYFDFSARHLCARRKANL
ncbi:MAG: tyrosine-protein phosphatase, partial [Treponemataceae bacterium]|nr:tyrosine-protein phosphatase [Treponemataceae bacterium]